MKNKRLIKYLLVSLFICIIFVLPKGTVYAEDGQTTINNVDLKINIKENGQYEITEFLTIKFDGKFNGGFRDISSNRLGKFENVKISLIQGDKEIPFTRNDSAENGDINVFEVIKRERSFYRIKMYIPSNDVERTFKISYGFSEGARLHEDIGEFYYNFWDKGYNSPLKKISATVNFPKGFNKDDLKIFFKGNKGLFKILDNKSIYFESQNISSKDYVTGRILFPKVLLKEGVKGTRNKEDILKEEKNIKEREVKKEKLKRNFDILAIGNTCIGLVLIVIFCLGREKNKTNLDISGAPADITPALVTRLLSRSIDISTFISTLLDLSRKGFLNIESFSRNGSEDYKITILQADTSILREHERYILKILMEYSNFTGILSLKDLSKYMKFNYTKFEQKLVVWGSLVKKEFKTLGFIDKTKRTFAKLNILVGCIIIGLSIVGIISNSTKCIVSIIVSIVVIILGIASFETLNSDGYAEIGRWKKLKGYFENRRFDYISSDYPLDLYFSYMICLGVSNNVLQNFREFIIESKIYNDNDWIMRYFYIDSFSTRHSFVGYSRHNYNKAKKYYEDTHKIDSSSSGGFSSGGGGGAGGGGAGGF